MDGSLGGFRRYTDKRDDVAHVQQQNNRQHKCNAREQRDDIADGSGRAVKPVRTDRTADGDSGPHGQTHDDHGEHVQHLASVRHSGDAVDPDELAGNEQIGHTIQRLQKIRQQVRQCKNNDGSQDIARRQILFHGLPVALLLGSSSSTRNGKPYYCCRVNSTIRHVQHSGN